MNLCFKTFNLRNFNKHAFDSESVFVCFNGLSEERATQRSARREAPEKSIEY